MRRQRWCPLYFNVTSEMCVMYELMTWEELRPYHERNAPPSFVTTVWILSVNCLQINKQNKGKGDQANGSMPPLKIIWTETRLQGCVVRKIEGSQVLWACEIQGTQHMICMQKLRFCSHRRGKVRQEPQATGLCRSTALDYQLSEHELVVQHWFEHRPTTQQPGVTLLT